MYRYLSILGIVIASGAPLSCDSSSTSNRTSDDERAVASDSILKDARNAEADLWAPAYYEHAELKLSERNVEEAELMARRATEEALSLRAEARRAADDHLRRAHILLELVETVSSHEPREGITLPDDDTLDDIRAQLQRADAAFASGDYVTAGLVAQSVNEALAGATVTTS